MENQACTFKKGKKRKISDAANIEVDSISKELLKQRRKKKNQINDVQHNEIVEEFKTNSVKQPLQQACLTKFNCGSDKTSATWKTEDYLELLRRTERQLPKNDNLTYSKRLSKLDWNEVQFDEYSADDCKEKWNEIKRNVRTYRILQEIIDDAKLWAVNPFAVGKNFKKKIRHPDFPSKPLSSYMLFYMDKKNKTTQKYPHLSMVEITKLVANKYKNLTERKKAMYVTRAKQLAEEYKNRLNMFYKQHPEFVLPPKTAPRPMAPFKLFLHHKLKKHENDEQFDKHSFENKYRNIWKKQSLKKKCYWINLAKEEEEQYLNRLQESGKDKPVTNYKSVISKEEYRLLDRLAGKPNKPPKSSYALFSRRMMENKEEHLLSSSPKTRWRDIAIKWKQVPQDQKKKYEEEVKQLNEKYKSEFASYLETLTEEKRNEEMSKLKSKKRILKERTHTIPDILKDEPVKPSPSALELYKQQFWKQDNTVSKKVAYKKASIMWKSLSLDERKKFEKKHEKLLRKYMEDFKQYLLNMNETELKEYYKNKNTKETELGVSDTDSNSESPSEDEAEDSPEQEEGSDESDSGAEDSPEQEEGSDESDSGESEDD